MPSELPSHVEWLIGPMSLLLEEHVSRQGGPADVRDILDTLCKADPSARKTGVQWMAERLLDRGFLWEDVRSGAGSKVHETLTAFGTHRRELPRPERNLVSHATLASAWESVAHLIPREDDEPADPGIRERRRRERRAARAESIIVCERPGLTVAVPLTEAASKWWGRGTRWCTAADKDNAFAEYNAQGPLFVIVLGDEKLQLFIGDGSEIQFMDASDKQVTAQILERNWDEIEPLMKWAVGQNVYLLDWIPVSLRDRQMYLKGVTCGGWSLEHVPGALADRDLCMAALRQDGRALMSVPYELRDQDMCITAVTQDGWALKFVPEEILDRDMCIVALKNNGWVIPIVPSRFIERELYLVAVSKNGDMLEKVPRAIIDREMCLAAVRQAVYALRHVPGKFQDDEMFLDAVTHHGCSLELIPGPLRSRQICLAAMEQDAKALRFVPDVFLDREICFAAVRRAGHILNSVPDKWCDREMCLAAVMQNGRALMQVPDDMLTKEICMAAVGQNGQALDFVPLPLRDLEMCLLALEHDGWPVDLIPASLRHLDQIVSAVSTRVNKVVWNADIQLRGLSMALSHDMGPEPEMVVDKDRQGP